jgi:subtilisin family serine protease
MSLLAPITQAIKVRQVYHNQHVFSGMSVQFDSDQPIRTFSKLLNIQPLLHSSLKRDSIQRRPTSIENNAWVKTIYPLYQVPQPDWTEEPMLASYAAAPTLPQRPFDDRISQTQSVHDKIGATGKDVLVCLLDSGVDYRHPALGGGIGAGFKIKMGANLVDPNEDDKSVGHHLEKDDPMDPCPANGTFFKKKVCVFLCVCVRAKVSFSLVVDGSALYK